MTSRSDVLPDPESKKNTTDDEFEVLENLNRYLKHSGGGGGAVTTYMTIGLLCVPNSPIFLALPGIR